MFSHRAISFSGCASQRKPPSHPSKLSGRTSAKVSRIVLSRSRTSSENGGGGEVVGALLRVRGAPAGEEFSPAGFVPAFTLPRAPPPPRGGVSFLVLGA